MVFSDGSTETVDAVVCATGYRLDLPYLDDDLRRRLVRGDELDLYQRTLHPDLPVSASSGSSCCKGLLAAAGAPGPLDHRRCSPARCPAPRRSAMRAVMATPRPAVESHHVLGLLLAEEQGVSPDPLAWPDLAEPLLFGPMLPRALPAQRTRGPPDAAELFSAQLRPVQAARGRARRTSLPCVASGWPRSRT